jgi:transposase
MQVAADRTDAPTAIQTDLPAIFVSLELSRSTWLITSLSPGAGEKMSKHSIRAGDVAGLLVRLAQLKEKARRRTVSGAILEGSSSISVMLALIV